MIESTNRALKLLAIADQTAGLEARNPSRMPDMIAEHRMLREELRQQLQILEGFQSEHHRLISLVFELLGTVTAATNGRADWTSELPPGRAPAFRRALNKAIAYLRGDGEQP